MIRYHIQPHSPEAHTYLVTLHIPHVDGDQILVTLPAWIPGSYMIRDFAKNIISLQVVSPGCQPTVQKTDKQTWCVTGYSDDLQIVYDIYAWDLSVRGAHLDTTHGYFNGTCVFLRVIGRETETCKVEISPPSGDKYENWRVATTLARSGAGHFRFGHYQARNYAELIDNPVEMGTFSHFQSTVSTTPHHIAITGRHSGDPQRFSNDLKKICETHVRMFGELPGMDQYLFQITAVGDGYGGLEHQTCTSLICNRDDLPARGATGVSTGYRRLLGLCSHEYFHLWNVKRIVPEAMRTADLSHETHTTLLWAFEGITSYYDDLGLVRSGCIDRNSYLELLAESITRVIRTPGRFRQSLAESSFDAWTKFYKQDENAVNAIVSYYAKGALVALSLDMMLRRISGGRQSLDDLMRLLWQRYGLAVQGVREGDIESLASELAGQDMNEFFQAYVYATEDPPLADLLSEVGVGVTFRAAKNRKDKGGLRDETSEVPLSKPTIGVRFKEDPQGACLTAVLEGAPAQQAGLSAGDVVVAVNSIHCSPDTIDELIAGVPEGGSVILHAFRRDELMVFDVRPAPAPLDTCDLWFLDDQEAVVVQARDSWLAGQ